MTAGYGSGDGTPGQGAGEAADDRWPERPEASRPGPLPPRFEPPALGHPPTAPGQPTPPATGFPATPIQPAAPTPGFGSALPAPPGAPVAGMPMPGQPAVPSARTTWSPPATGGQWGSGPAPGAEPGQGGWSPGEPAAGPVPGQSPAAQHPMPGPSTGQPVAGPAYPGQPAGPAYPGGQPGWPAAPPAGPASPTRRRRLAVAALAAVLAVVAGVQAYQIHRLGDRLAATDRRLAEAQNADGARFDGLEKRAEALEKEVGAAFNPEAVAAAVLPSVFRVRAGEFTGTAFAIGKPASGGGANLLTNFHVVESVWDGGGRQVFLERTDQRFPATIVKVDKAKDIAQLRTTAKFAGLVAARTPVKSGQQIVVVGAPLGLQDSVTTGVVSAFRKDEGGSGPVIQFDAPINPGNSGGPVINGSKEVVGIATAKARDAEGIGLAVPIKTACDAFKLC
ncbi:Trypsin-like peptidase domain-containing protein [Micromonospora rhizosphaerae]|uniref:Trypsin-like peptidase domain-containing protein n=1 Tax=Micromonospora rhizosphaerae TaxID=568872 RepID=A0A1C6RYX7_9ACTN|nr:S1C family serine protease [Micromonospora rhizosphaerae]SCL22232.1 Trypsin-like peptidase domain-containing protein [Micromonospora rhizosphaerae]